MKRMSWKLGVGSSVLLVSVFCFASPVAKQSQVAAKNTKPVAQKKKANHTYTAVQYRNIEVDHAQSNPFGIALYKPTYLLPYNYTASPDYAVYHNDTPLSQEIKKQEVKFQFSFKAPIWKNIFHLPATLYGAYTQVSYWQAYTDSAFFRESNYQPEIFLETTFNPHFFLDAGVVHQSNGRGGDYERSWNRSYLNFVFSTQHWMFSLKPWIVFNDEAYRRYNPGMAKYLGHARYLMAFTMGRVTLSFMARNQLESNFKRGAYEITASIPLTQRVKLYGQFFDGFGQSLIEYNHRTEAFGVGFALNDWV